MDTYSVTPPNPITFENHWLTSVDPSTNNTFTVFQQPNHNKNNNNDSSSSTIPILKTSSSNNTTTSANETNHHQSSAPSSSSRKMRIKKNREPIFVTESPQNAYKKKSKRSNNNNNGSDYKDSSNSSSSPSSNFDDDEDMDDQDQLTSMYTKGMTAKERRQIRNKISARNFRVRRKEYINQLENKVDEQEDEIDQLKQENKKLQALNGQLMEEIMQLKLQQQSSNITPLPSELKPPSQNELPEQQAMAVTPISSTSSHSPPNFMDSLLDFNLFNSIDFNNTNTNDNDTNANNNNNTTYLAHALIPSFDLSRVLDDKLSQPPSSIGNQHELMNMYPLLAPALASIVIKHTFTLHYVAYLSESFPYNHTPSFSNKNNKEVMDILRPDDWMNAMTLGYRPQVSANAGDEDSDDDEHSNGVTESIPSHMLEHDMATKRLKEKWNKKHGICDPERCKDVLWTHYPHYVYFRLRGYSHEEIMVKYKECMEKKHLQQQQKRIKNVVSCNKLELMKAFASVATTMVRNPTKLPLITGVLQEAKIIPIHNPIKKPSLFTLKPAKYHSTLKIRAK
ncbi:unnamed protein product [Cunninghamella echinulata]